MLFNFDLRGRQVSLLFYIPLNQIGYAHYKQIIEANGGLVVPFAEMGTYQIHIVGNRAYRETFFHPKVFSSQVIDHCTNTGQDILDVDLQQYLIP